MKNLTKALLFTAGLTLSGDVPPTVEATSELDKNHLVVKGDVTNVLKDAPTPESIRQKIESLKTDRNLPTFDSEFYKSITPKSVRKALKFAEDNGLYYTDEYTDWIEQFYADNPKMKELADQPVSAEVQEIIDDIKKLKTHSQKVQIIRDLHHMLENNIIDYSNIEMHEGVRRVSIVICILLLSIFVPPFIRDIKKFQQEKKQIKEKETLDKVKKKVFETINNRVVQNLKSNTAIILENILEIEQEQGREIALSTFEYDYENTDYIRISPASINIEAKLRKKVDLKPFGIDVKVKRARLSKFGVQLNSYEHSTILNLAGLDISLANVGAATVGLNTYDKSLESLQAPDGKILDLSYLGEKFKNINAKKAYFYNEDNILSIVVTCRNSKPLNLASFGEEFKEKKIRSAVISIDKNTSEIMVNIKKEFKKKSF